MTRFIVRISGSVDTGPEPDSHFKLLPIAPRILAEQIPALLRRLLEVAGHVDVTVGAFSVTIQQDPELVTPEPPAGRRGTQRGSQGQPQGGPS